MTVKLVVLIKSKKITFSQDELVSEHVELVNALKAQPNKSKALKRLLKEQEAELKRYKKGKK